MTNLQTCKWRNTTIKLILFGLFALMLTACGGNEAANNHEGVSTNDAGDNPAINEATNTNDSFDEAGEAFEYPDLIPSDMPVPSDAQVTLSTDKEEQGTMGLNTSTPLDEIEALYDDYFANYPDAEDLEKELYEEDDHTLLTYSIDRDDYFFYIRTNEPDESTTTIHIDYVKY